MNALVHNRQLHNHPHSNPIPNTIEPVTPKLSTVKSRKSSNAQ